MAIMEKKFEGLLSSKDHMFYFNEQLVGNFVRNPPP